WLVCHDWVFTGGRCSPPAGVVPLILEDKGYHTVDEPAPRDPAGYRPPGSGGIIHNALGPGGPARRAGVGGEGAWLGRSRHPAALSYPPYPVGPFYASDRAGPVLRGLEQPPPAPTPAGEQTRALARPGKPAAPLTWPNGGPCGAKRCLGGPATAPAHGNPAMI